MNKEKLIEIKNLKTYFTTEAGIVKAVDDVSFNIYKGEVLGIVGESGSGKSVTSLSINRLIPNPPGEIVSGEIIYTKSFNLEDNRILNYKIQEDIMVNNDVTISSNSSSLNAASLLELNPSEKILVDIKNDTITIKKGARIIKKGTTMTQEVISKLTEVNINKIKFNINLLDLDHRTMRRYRGRDIAMIFQEPMTSLNPVLKIKTQMNEVLIHHFNLSKTEATKRSIQMLEAVGLPNPDERMNEYPHQFSGGMRQRVMIAMALQCNPTLLIADEPTTALDVTIQAQILDLMMDVKEKRDESAILLITHDLAVVAETCDRVVVMYGGKVQEVAEINELFENPLHPYTKALMESIPKMDIKEKRLKALKGMVQTILNMGNKCKFCSRFDPEDCACGGTGKEPDIYEVKPNHFIRCNPAIIKKR